MVKSIFEEEFLQGKVEGIAVGKVEGIAEGIAVGKVEGRTEHAQESVLSLLRRRFNNVPVRVEKIIQQMSDIVALDSLLFSASECKSLSEFAKELQ
jgi:flagellar biosynthesis/type III secretory pathway protein FliH